MRNLERSVLFLFFLVNTIFAKAQVVTIPDANFKAALIARGVDGNSDGQIQTSEALAVATLDVGNKSISDLTGIQSFTNLTTLYCDSNNLTSLDVSQNLKIVNLFCLSNALTVLDITKNTQLVTLSCDANKLSSLNVSQNTQLTGISCYANLLTTLDVTKNTKLTMLVCYSNSLSSLDVSLNTQLLTLACYSNSLSMLDITKNIQLTTLYCYLNKLTSLNVSLNTQLATLYCYSNLLTTLDVTKNGQLTTLYCYSNKLTSLDVSKNLQLSTLSCYSNSLTALDVSKNTKLTTLYYSSNPLTTLNVSNTNAFTTLDLSAYTTLTSLTCRNTKLTSLKVSSNTNLTYLDCGNNLLTTLDVSNNIKLTTLNCDSNQFSVLDMTKNIDLANLNCNSNKLANLNLTLNKKLLILSFEYNQLTTLDLSQNTMLTDLSFMANKMTSLSLITNTSLTKIDCRVNSLSTLDLSQNTKLTTLSCSSNKFVTLSLSTNIELTHLQCNANQITTLDVTKNTKLIVLAIYANKVSSLDVSKNTELNSLDCRKNELLFLDLTKNTKLKILQCVDNTNLSCISTLPTSLTSLPSTFTGTSVTCVANKPVGIASALAAYPICGPFNKNNCYSGFVKVVGTVFYDLNSNSIKDANETYVSGVNIGTSATGFSAATNNAGCFELYFTNTGTYTITPKSLLYHNFSPISVTRTYVALDTKDSVSFALVPQATSVQDLSVSLASLAANTRPGAALPMLATIQNEGNRNVDGTFAISLPAEYVLDSVNDSGFKNNTMAVQGLNPGQKIYLTLYGRVSPSAVVGKTMNVSATISTTGTEQTPANNTFTLKTKINGSFASNNAITSALDTITPAQIASGEYKEFSVHFQNVGNAVAKEIIIKDTLSSLFDLNTLEILRVSHLYDQTVANGIIYGRFPRINLADSMSNKAKSVGSVRFKIKVKSSPKPAHGTFITNNASIFFDDNSPKITNVAKILVFDPTVLNVVKFSSNSAEENFVYPNPNSGEPLRLNLPEGSTFKISNMQGEEVMNGTVDSESINITFIPASVYLLETWQNGIHKTTKLVKQ